MQFFLFIYCSDDQQNKLRDEKFFFKKKQEKHQSFAKIREKTESTILRSKQIILE